MSLFTLDFETAYDQEYSLSKLSTLEYVTDPRFEVILCGIQKDDEKPYWITGTQAQLQEQLDSLELDRHIVLAHNMMFDGLILEHHFNIVPKMYCDTMLIGNAWTKPFSRSVSLANMAEFYKMGTKGDEVVAAKGKWRKDFTKPELEKYASYCMNDCTLTYKLFRHLGKQLPRDELRIIDLTLRMYLQPKLHLDSTVLAEVLAEEKSKKEVLLANCPMIDKDTLMSNSKFAAALITAGIEPPMKISKSTGLPTFAFAKTDAGFMDMLEEYEEHPVLGPLLLARVGLKSTTTETRAQRLLDMSLIDTKFRVPLRYYAAHTGRDGGMESINAQNLQRPEKSRIRQAVIAPKGCVVLAADLAQIEARLTAWFCGQLDLLQQFRQGMDVYAIFASELYGRDIDKKTHPIERFVGKTSILSLGFGVGVTKFMVTLRKDKVILQPHEAHRAVNLYRSLNAKIPAMWQRLDDALAVMAGGGVMEIGPCLLGQNCITMPNGMLLIYDQLQQHDGSWQYSYGGLLRKLWGGSTLENIIQTLARIIIMDLMLRVQDALKLRPTLRVHDELVYVVPADAAEDYKAEIIELAAVPPDWAPDLPVVAEVNYGKNYFECK